MRKITEHDLIAWLDGITSAGAAPENYRQPEAAILRLVASRPNFQATIVQAFFAGGLNAKGPPLAGAPPGTAVPLDVPSGCLSVWATGFQMGRHFEQARIEADELKSMMEREKE